MERSQDESALNRRRFMAGTAALGAAGTATAAGAVDPDPIFTLIERERLAWAAFNDAISYTGEAEEALFELKRADAGESEAALELKRVVRKRFKRQHKADERASDALYDVMAATPTTAAGLLAMIDLFWARSHDMLNEPVSTDLPNLFEAIRTIVGRQA